MAKRSPKKLKRPSKAELESAGRAGDMAFRLQMLAWAVERLVYDPAPITTDMLGPYCHSLGKKPMIVAVPISPASNKTAAAGAKP